MKAEIKGALLYQGLLELGVHELDARSIAFQSVPYIAQRIAIAMVKRDKNLAMDAYNDWKTRKVDREMKLSNKRLNSGMVPLSPESGFEEDVFDRYNSHGKIYAVKLYRDVKGASLRSSIAAVEEIVAKMSREH